MTAKEWLSQYPVLQTKYYRMFGDEENEHELSSLRTRMNTIKQAIDSIDDLLYGEVLTLRYTEGNAGRLMPWRDVAFAMYHNDTPADLKRIQRLHRKALKMVKLPNG